MAVRVLVPVRGEEAMQSPMIALVMIAAACGGPRAPAGPPPPSGSTWRADLKCREDPTCVPSGPDCSAIAPPAERPSDQCGGTQKPRATDAERERYRDTRDAQIDAQTWPCTCYCVAAAAREREACMMAP